MTKTKLWGTERLDDGRRFEIIKVEDGDAEFHRDIVSLLGHKGEPWVWHIEQCLSGRTPGLQSSFYLARLGGRFVGNVTVFRNDALGNISHVFTAADMRRLGIARCLLTAAISDFEQQACSAKRYAGSRSRGGQVMVLSTGFESSPYWLYQSLGFQPTCPELEYGGMVRFLGDADWERVMIGPPGEVCPASWKHFVGTQLLFGQPGGEQLRSLHLPSIGPRLVESGFIGLKYRQDCGEPVGVWVIEGAGCAVLGCAVVGAHPLWKDRGTHQVLDLYVHSRGREAAPALVEKVLQAAAGPVECYCDSLSDWRVKLLRELGFAETRLPSALRFGEAILDLVIMSGDSGS